MKRLNPLYIISLFMTILFISIFLLSEQKDLLKEKTEEQQELLSLLKRIKDDIYKQF